MTEAELVDTFNTLLGEIVEGQRRSVPTCTGLDWQTLRVLNQLAAQPKKKAVDIMACRIEFGRMLDGTHAAEDKARDDAEWDYLLG